MEMSIFAGNYFEMPEMGQFFIIILLKSVKKIHFFMACISQ
jgi:hypothetical protein